ncbi:hypothetical protein CRYUN_Cryun13aG0029500 [Craigia yunnanensis]
MAAMSGKEEEQSLISLVSIPDGLELEDNRKDTLKFTENILVGWALEVAKNMGIEGIAVHFAGSAGLALSLRVIVSY